MKRTALLLIFGMLLVSCATTTGQSGRSLSPETKEALLRERVMTMWNAQVKGDRATMYDLYDPFYRAKENKGAFVGTAVPLFYYNPEIKEIGVKGNVATVRVQMEYELRRYMVRGREVSQAKQQVVTTETWLFIDGNWYRLFFDNLTEAPVARY
jgi:hypothetical protein